EVIMGNVLQGGVGQAPGRQEAIHGGRRGTLPALTINEVCGTGLKAVMLGAQAVRAGDEQCVVAGGMESMSNAPHYAYGLRGGIKVGNANLVDGMIHDGLWDAFSNTHMGNLAVYTAQKAGVSRADQDAFALASAGGEPRDLFFAPIVAVQKLLAKTQTQIGDYDLIEANEAFAVQAIADGRALGWDCERVNVNGGAIALGHPIGASGARILT